MIRFTISLAGVACRIEAQFESTRTFCQDYLTEMPPEIFVKVSPEDLLFERKKSAAEDELEHRPVRPFPDAYLETLSVYRKLAEQLLKKDILLFHGSVVAVDGQAFLFTAQSGTGKTTHTDLWMKTIPGAYVVNGDKPLLKITEQSVIACGTPWQGKECFGRNVQVPLKALCLLERGEVNRIDRVSVKEALPMLMQQSWSPSDRDGLSRKLTLISRLCSIASLYRLQCNMETEAAQVSFNGMK